MKVYDMWPENENGVYRRRYNFELEMEFDNTRVINVVKTSRLRYAIFSFLTTKTLSQNFESKF
jgi:hypothetical protein